MQTGTDKLTCKLCGNELLLSSGHIITVTIKSGDKVTWRECDNCRAKKLALFNSKSVPERSRG